MGFTYRKSVNLSPFRVNLSKSGLGYSVGGRGFRVGTTARGKKYTSFSIPGTGVGYRKSGAGCLILLAAVPVGIATTKLLILILFQNEIYYAFFSGWQENPPSIRLSSIKPKKSPTIPSAPAPSAYVSLFCFPRGSEPRWNKSHPSLA